MAKDVPIPVYEKSGQKVIKIDDLMAFLSHRKEQQELMYNATQVDSISNLITVSLIVGEIDFIRELLKKPKYIFTTHK